MPSYEQIKSEILHLSKTCEHIRPATTDDEIYRCFVNPPKIDPEDIEEGMYLSVNKTMDSVFGAELLNKNVFTGPYGVDLVIKWSDKAREHKTWDKSSDQLLKLKLERIRTHLIDSGGLLPNNSPIRAGLTASKNTPKGKKRRVVSQPSPDINSNKSVSNIDKPAAKRQQPEAPSSVVVISSDDDENQHPGSCSTGISANKTSNQKTSNKISKISKISDILRLCPLSKDDKPCTRCRVETAVLGNKYFWCHCSNKRLVLSNGRVETAAEHWKSKRCQVKTRHIQSSAVLTSFYATIPAEPKKKKGYEEVPCPGLTDATWERPKATYSIAYFIEHTCTIYRGNDRNAIRKELFGEKATESSLTKTQKAQLISTLDSRAIWEVKRHGERSGVYSKKCLRTGLRKKNSDDVPCAECEEIKGNHALISALNHKYADDDNLKFINDHIMSTDAFHATIRKYAELKMFDKSLESSRDGDFGDFLTRLAAHARRGLFQNCEVVQGLIKQVSLRAEREAAGKSLRGLRIDAYLDDTLTTLGAMSRSALELFNSTFAGRGIRSQRAIQAKNGKMEAEIHPANFERIAKTLKELGYDGPIAAASDQTVCVKALRHHNGCLVGAEGGDVKFSNADELRDLMKEIVKGDKLCSELIQYKSLYQTYLQHYTIITHALRAGINIMSMGADGAATEISAQEKLKNKTDQYLTYSKSSLNVYVKVPLFGDPPRPVVTVQDPKHARKTGANQLLSGARLIVIGMHVMTIQQLAQILQMPNSPLMAKDVFDCDKQEDGRAFRTTNSLTLAASLRLPGNEGLAIFLYVIGELVDSWLNKKIGHRERIRSAWTAGFFLRRWKAYLQKRETETNGLMTFHLNCISHASFKIFSSLPESLLALIISHRQYYPDYPLCPWKHGTESCEHIFGWMRVIAPRFTVLDARFMMPKIHAVVKSVMGGKIKIPPSEHMHSGYQYAWGDEEAVEAIELLKQFPTNAEIGEELTIANRLANSLAHLAGMGPLEPEDEDLPVQDILNGLPPDLDDTTPDVSTCATKDYRVKYNHQPGDFPENVTFAEAATLAKEQNSLDILLDQVPDEVETDTVQNAAMVIANLLNSDARLPAGPIQAAGD
ncbi:uncharacterized protein MELLADRAFT_87741 [Melampsora larici-populina 98AG31]|uniref:Uncharacterized protein n=1 Tax=Melampsora larici-populina (strain 98AG31 / pathotype 3-4-7) TaxID=747676 RepID=F4RNW8_MELLP|nr:uncharacterized protein MELLADRAFT_87741 [Melampsora larici-populina 98AG31]EGG05841.1 hypothetical protein MELLADRAFT_87741 [Melampsora larici-populina 98AG31]